MCITLKGTPISQQWLSILMMNGSFNIFSHSFQDGKTPLHVACIKQDFPMVQMLVERGANTAAQDQVYANHMTAQQVPIITKHVMAKSER